VGQAEKSLGIYWAIGLMVWVVILIVPDFCSAFIAVTNKNR